MLKRSSLILIILVLTITSRANSQAETYKEIDRSEITTNKTIKSILENSLEINFDDDLNITTFKDAKSGEVYKVIDREIIEIDSRELKEKFSDSHLKNVKLVDGNIESFEDLGRNKYKVIEYKYNIKELALNLGVNLFAWVIAFILFAILVSILVVVRDTLFWR